MISGPIQTKGFRVFSIFTILIKVVVSKIRFYLLWEILINKTGTLNFVFFNFQFLLNLISSIVQYNNVLTMKSLMKVIF